MKRPVPMLLGCAGVAACEAHSGRFACAEVTIEALRGAAEAHVALARPADAFAIWARAVDECEAPDLRLASLAPAFRRIAAETHSESACDALNSVSRHLYGNLRRRRGAPKA